MRGHAWVVVGLVAAGAAQGAKVQTWRQESAKDLASGHCARVVVTSEGEIRLSRQIGAFADPKAEHVWDLAVDRSGNVWAAMGSPGRVLRIEPSGQQHTVYENQAEQIFCIAVAGDGTVYAGTSPTGKVLRFGKDGTSRVHLSTNQTYIWDLAVDAAGKLYAATGTTGKLLVVDEGGRSKLLLETRQPHLLSLAVAESGVVFVGTSGEGLVYRVDPAGTSSILHDASEADIQALLLAKDGTLYAGTGTPSRPQLPSASTQQAETAQAGTSGQPTSPTTSSISSAGSGSSRPTSSSGVVGNNSVYRIRPDGVVDSLFQRQVLVLSLGLHEDQLLLGTGQEGRLYAVHPASRVHEELARLEHGQVHALAQGSDGTVWLASGAPGQIYRMAARHADAGTYTSQVLDAKMQTRWGRAVWREAIPPGCGLAVTFRTGNVAEPDTTWSAWMRRPQELPLGRFFQYRVTLTSPEGTATPSLRDLGLYYATVNQPPVIDSIDVPDMEKSPATAESAKLKLSWKATDPNSDALTYRLEVQKEDWPDWVALVRDHERTEYEWDPAAVPEGRYRARLTASDRPANRDEDARSVVRTSEPFIVDRQSPAVRIIEAKASERQIRVRATATDQQTRLTEAQYALDGNTWVALVPDDGLFDGPDEQATFRCTVAEAGTHLLVVRFRDAAGHWGLADTIVTVEP